MINSDSINFMEILNNPAYAGYGYTVAGQEYYPTGIHLNDNEGRSFKVIFERGNLPEWCYKDSINHFICDLNAKNQRGISLNHAVKDLLKENYEKGGNTIKNMDSFDKYCDYLGMSKLSFSYENLLHFLRQSENILDISRLCKSSLPEKVIREFITKTLQNQEDEILKNIPCDDPDQMRDHFEKLLAEKNTTYEEIVGLCNWSQGRPKKLMPEGGYVLAKLIAQVDAWKELKPKGLPFKDVWRFFIDGSKEQHGAYFFENEPFYMLSSLRGLKDILESKEAPSQKTYEGYAAALTRNPPVFKDTRGFTWSDSSLIEDATNVFFGAKMQNKGQHFDGRNWKRDEIGMKDLEKRTLAADKACERVSSQRATDRDYFRAK